MTTGQWKTEAILTSILSQSVCCYCRSKWLPLVLFSCKL